MGREIASIDITTSEDLLRLVEDVRRTGKARVLRRGDEPVALISPLRTKIKGQPRPPKAYSAEDDAAFLSAAGAWEDFDLDEFLRANEESRSRSRPPVDL